MLVGIKDTNDELVALTLRALAELVPLLGSEVVIGGKRAKLFTDGRPVLHSVKVYKPRNIQNNVEPSPTHLSNSTPALSSMNLTDSQLLVLPERPQPDGEEVDTSTDEVEPSADDDLETWEDWDANENNASNIDQPVLPITPTEITVIPAEPDLLQSSAINTSKYETHRKKSLPDITELDIKNQRNNGNNGDDVDFFQDMEPVIDTKPRFAIVDSNSLGETEAAKKMSLIAAVAEETAEEGWGDEEWD